jgi:glycosyltransferase involved in cell wall biosynthesis
MVSGGGQPLMRVLIISQYFPPETGGPPNRMYSLALGCRDAGHEVTVIAEKPNHPEGVIRKEYRGGLIRAGNHRGIPVLYTWVFARPKKTFRTRMLFYLSFMAMAVAAASRLRERYDVVLASSPPLFVGLAGWAASRLKGSKFVFDVRDLWPDVAVAVGELREGRALRLAKRLELFLYTRADGITAVTRGFCESIARLAPAGKPIVRITNGTVPEVFERAADTTAFRARFGLEGCYVVTFAGNLGVAQGLGHLLDTAEILVRKDFAVRIVLMGDGPVRETLGAEAARRRLTNVVFVPRASLDEAAGGMAASDALLVPLARHPIYRMFIPSKLFDCMASGKPVLLSVDGEAREILDQAGGGLFYPAEDGQALADLVLWLKAHPTEAAGMGRRAAAYVRSRFDRRSEAARMAAFLAEIAGRPSPAQPTLTAAT